MYGYLCIGFIDSMLKGKSLLDYTNLFSPNDYKKNKMIVWTVERIKKVNIQKLRGQKTEE